MSNKSVQSTPGRTIAPRTARYDGPYTTGPSLNEIKAGASWKVGHYHPEIEAVQKALNQLGADLKQDGYYGDETNAEVMRFQAKDGLVMDGKLGPKTLAQLHNAVAALESPTPHAHPTHPPRTSLTQAPDSPGTLPRPSGHRPPRDVQSATTASKPSHAPRASATVIPQPQQPSHAPRAQVTAPAADAPATPRAPRQRPRAQTAEQAPAATEPRVPKAPRHSPRSQAIATEATVEPNTRPTHAPRTGTGIRTVEQKIAVRKSDAGTYATVARVGERISINEAAPKISRVVGGTELRPACDMSPAEAEAELVRLGVAFKTAPAAAYVGIANPVLLEYPLFGVGVHYVVRKHDHVGAMDVRTAVALAHFTLWAKERGVVEIEHKGVHVLHKHDDPDVLKTDRHGRGMAFDIGALIVDHPPGELVAGSSPARYRVDVLRHWGTATSSEDIGGSARTVVAQTPEEVANMSGEEALLRDAWGFLVAEMGPEGITVVPSSNRDHIDHIHVDLKPTMAQHIAQNKEFAGYLDEHPEKSPNYAVGSHKSKS